MEMSTESISVASAGFHLLSRSRVKVVVVGSAVAAVIFGAFFGFYWRRKKKSIPSKTSEKAKCKEKINDTGTKRGTSPAIGLPSKPSSSSLTGSRRRRRGSASRSTSTSVVEQLGPVREENVSARRRVIHQAVDCLSESVTKFDLVIKMLLRDGKTINRQDKDFAEGLENTLDIARRLETDLNSLIERFCPEALEEESIASTLTPAGSHQAIYDASLHTGHVTRTFSVLSDDSFVSAMEELMVSFPEVEAPVHDVQSLPFEQLEFYQVGWTKVQQGEVQCRCLRTEFLHCLSDEDFLAKLYCVREALAVLLKDQGKRIWISDTFRDILSALLDRAGKDASGFQTTYDALVNFVNNIEDWTELTEEFHYRKINQVTFYDVVLDLILMDAFDDLAHPPASVIAVAQNRFLSAGFKESTLNTVVWSVIKAKRARAWSSKGFFARFYDVSEHVSPTMAWGFLGTDENLRELCYYFKDQMCNFLTDIFSVDRVRYTNLTDLADDIYRICEARMTSTRQRLIQKRDSISPSPSPPLTMNHKGSSNDNRV